MQTLTQAQIEALSVHLEQAEQDAREVLKITDEFPQMSYRDAFDIQWAIRRRKVAAGARITGMKMGLTSWAKMSQMGVEQPCYGFLTDVSEIPEGGTIEHDQLIHPKIEAEIAFVLKHELRGPGVHIADVLRATDFIMPAVEVIDSRYKDFRFDLKSVIADNSSSSRYMTGGCVRAADSIDLRTLGVVMEINGRVVATGAGAAVLGHPAASVAMLANMLADRDEVLPAGSFIMVGAITAAMAVEKGDSFCVRYQGLGSLSGRFI